MATTTTTITTPTITRAMALQAAIDLLTANGKTGEVDVLTRMLEQVQKPRKRTHTTSRATQENHLVADILAEITDHGEILTTPMIMEGSPYARDIAVISPQKVSAIMKLAIADGTFIRVKEGKKVAYQRV